MMNYLSFSHAHKNTSTHTRGRTTCIIVFRSRLLFFMNFSVIFTNEQMDECAFHKFVPRETQEPKKRKTKKTFSIPKRKIQNSLIYLFIYLLLLLYINIVLIIRNKYAIIFNAQVRITFGSFISIVDSFFRGRFSDWYVSHVIGHGQMVVPLLPVPAAFVQPRVNTVV